MEQTKTKTAPPPSYTTDSDVESIIKPEKHECKEKDNKALPIWQNNLFFRTNHRRLVCVGVLSTTIILAIILGVLGSRGLLMKPKQEYGEGECVRWVYQIIPAPRSDTSTEFADNINVYCALWVGGANAGNNFAATATLDINDPVPTTSAGSSCLGWVSDIVSSEGNRAVINWRCAEWDRTLGDSSIATSTAFGSSALGDSALNTATLGVATAARSIGTTLVVATAIPSRS